MKILSVVIIIFSLCIPAFSQDNPDIQESIESILEARSNKFETFERLSYIKADSIRKFFDESTVKLRFSWKKKAAIRIIEENLYTSNYLLKWENVLKDRTESIFMPNHITSDCDNSIKCELNNIISKKEELLDILKNIKGLKTFFEHNEAVYCIINKSIKFDRTLLDYIENLITNSEIRIIENAEYQRLKQQAENQLNSLEMDIYKRMVKLNYDLEKFMEKKYSHISQ